MLGQIVLIAAVTALDLAAHRQPHARDASTKMFAGRRPLDRHHSPCSPAPAAVVLALAGFFWFVCQIATEEVTLDRKADGIVVLTGAATRIPDAIELLAAERGKRLLITRRASAAPAPTRSRG